MSISEILILAGLIMGVVMSYVGWVHHKTGKIEDRLERTRETMNKMHNEAARQYVDKQVGDKMFQAIDEIKSMIGQMNSRIEVLFDRHESR